MSGTLTPSSLFAALVAGIRVVGGVRPASLANTLATWRNRHRSRLELSELPPHLLNDIGLNREAAASEWQKPFWR